MKNVLLVEDDVILRHVLSGQLSGNGFTVSEAQNGEEALEILKLEKPDVILLDLILPGIDGFEVLKQIKGDLLMKNIYVIVISNLGDDEAIKRAFNLGADDYFVKAQYPIKAIIEKVNSYFGKNGNKKEEKEVEKPKEEMVVSAIKKEKHLSTKSGETTSAAESEKKMPKDEKNSPEKESLKKETRDESQKTKALPKHRGRRLQIEET